MRDQLPIQPTLNLEILLRGPILSDLVHDPVESISTPHLLAAHKLSKIRVHEVPLSSSLPLIAPFRRPPHSLNLLSVHASVRVHEVILVVHLEVFEARLLEFCSAIPLPAVREDGRSRSNVLFDAFEECGSRAIRYLISW